MRPRITMGWLQYLVVLLGLCTMGVVWEILPEPYHGLGERLDLLASREYQREFGFEIGPIEDGVTGISYVTPGGRFDRADIRSGDGVFTRHGGGFGELLWALKSASAKEMACLDVFNVANWRATRDRATRMVCIGPEVACQRSGDWDGVLALAARPFAESREALRRAAVDQMTDEGKLAGFVLREAAQPHRQEFTLATPRLLSRVVFSVDELQLALDTPAISRLVAARVDVDARGCAARVSLRDLASTDALAPLVVERLQRAVFVPAKPEAQFIGGAIDISLFVDVR